MSHRRRVLLCFMPSGVMGSLALLFYLWPLQMIFILGAIFAAGFGYAIWLLTGSASGQGRP